MKTILLLAAISPLLAHDMWIEPATFMPKPGELVGVKLRVGQDLLGDPLARNPELIREFVVENGQGRTSLVGRAGADPAGYFRAGAGLQVIGYSSNPSSVEQEPQKFAQYLKEEGLEHIAKATGQAKVRELFSRCAKSLVQVGLVGTAMDRRVGCTLELIAERNPYALRQGEALQVRLTYQDQALAGALVVAMNRKYPLEKLTARTDRDGRVRLPLRQEGLWLIKAVHIVPAGTPNADWSSYWASLTFDLGVSK